MTIFDYCVLAILVLSILLSVVRGVVRELLSLAGWVVAFMVANSFAAGFAPMLPSSIVGEPVACVAGICLVILIGLLAMGLITMLISALVKLSGLGFADRFLGSLFGFARGMLVVLLVVLAAGFTAAARAFLEKGRAEQAAGNCGDDGHPMVASGFVSVISIM